MAPGGRKRRSEASSAGLDGEEATASGEGSLWKLPAFLDAGRWGEGGGPGPATTGRSDAGQPPRGAGSRLFPGDFGRKQPRQPRSQLGEARSRQPVMEKTDPCPRRAIHEIIPRRTQGANGYQW